jgi:hypothetical protein
MALKISELQIPLVIIGINLLALLNKKARHLLANIFY